MPSDEGRLADWVLRYLAEIGVGHCSITTETIVREPDPDLRELMVGFLVLHEDLELERKRRNEAVSARDEFISIASHELRTPLTSIRLQLELLDKAKAALSPKDAPLFEARTSVLQRQLRRLESLVGELLDISRITSERLELNVEPTDLRALVFEVRERFSPEIARHGVELTVNAPEPVQGMWDPLRLDQVLTNLIFNALRYGEGRPVEVEVLALGSNAVFSVMDHGIGISPENQQRIFQPFARAVSTKHYGGLGLGLWIVRRIVEAMGGTIAVDSEPGKGSVFTVDLPREPANAVVKDGRAGGPAQV